MVNEQGITVKNLSNHDPMQQWDVVEITVPLTSAEVPAAQVPLQSGDYFYMNFPPSLTMFTGHFAIQNAQGVAVADCAVSGGTGGPAADGTPDLKCTFNDAISNFSSFTGQLRIGAQLNSEQQGGTWAVDINGETTYQVEPPGGGVVIGSPEETPDEIDKYGWFEADAADPTVMLWIIEIPKNTAANGAITITDTLVNATAADHTLVLDPAPQLRVRDAIPAPEGSPDNSYSADDPACPWTFTPTADLRGFTAVISDQCFDPSKYYTLYYRSKVANPGALVDGETFANSAVIAGNTQNSGTTYYQYADGSINGPGFGGVAVRKDAIAGPGGADVPADTPYTMTATYTQNNQPVTQTVTVTAGGTQAAINQIPEGTKVTLSELSTPTVPGVTWGDPVFSSTNPNVEIAPDGKSAVITVGDQTIVGVHVTNTAYGPPDVDIEKWSSNEAGPAYDAAGSVTNNGYAGDHDAANVKILDPATPEKINFTVSNNGRDDLKNIKVRDTPTAGPALQNIQCVFPDDSTGVTWSGPFAVGTQFTCTATLPALGYGATHADTATVVGVGVHSGTEVTDKDEWSGQTPQKPAIDIEKYNTAEGYPAGDHDTAADAKEIAAGAVDPVTMTITNTGNQVLVEVSVSDKTIEGVTLTGLGCVFPDGTTGTSWAGPFMPGASFDCTGTIPAQADGAVHADTATVVAKPAIWADGSYGPQPEVPAVTDSDDYHDRTPAAPPAKPRPPLAITGTPVDVLLPIGALTLIAGAGMLLLGRRRA